MNISADELRTQLRARLEGANFRQAAREVGVSHVTLGTFLKGGVPQPETLGKVRDYLAQSPQTRDDYWAGVNYAALAMSETITRLLREMASARRVSPVAADAISAKRLAETAGRTLSEHLGSDASKPSTRRRRGNA